MYLHHGSDFKARITIACEASRNVNTGSVPANSPHDGALVDVAACYFMFVQGESLIATAIIASNGIFAPAIFAHFWEGQALIYIDLVDKPQTLKKS